MGLVDYALLALAAFAGLAAAAVGIMLTLPSPNYRAIRFTLWITAFCFGVMGMLWGTISSDQKMWVRLFAAGVTAAVAAMALTYMLSIIQKPHENPPDAAVVAANIKADKIRMARRWVRLSDEILADLPMAKPQPNMTPFDKDITPDLRNRLWQQENQRMIQTFQDGLNRMSQKYLGRVAEAKIELQSADIPLNDSLLNSPMINSFSWEAWAQKLGGEGRSILTGMGEQE